VICGGTASSSSVLAWRDVAVCYKQTVIGAAWAVIRPFVTMVVFTVIFGKLANLPSDGTAPYAIMVFAGMLSIPLTHTFFSWDGELKLRDLIAN
jgi:lipopolysaccharide transport system permease protein